MPYYHGMVRGFAVFVFVMFAVGGACYAVVVILMSQVLLRPRRMSDARGLYHLKRLSPADLGMEFENISFQVIDEQDGRKLKIAGWWIPHASANGRCAIIVHGYGDAKVGGIAWAPLLHSLGFSVLVIDLRAHGESEGTLCTAGFWERHDLNQVIDQIKTSRPAQTQHILLFGVSLGAAVVAATALLREDLAAVILECPYAGFQQAAANQADRIGVPGPFFQKPAFKLAQWFAGSDFSAVRPVQTVPKIKVPLMVIQACDDPFVSVTDREALRRAVESPAVKRSPSVYWELQGVHHVVGMRMDPTQYRTRIEDFLSQALPSTAVICEK